MKIGELAKITGLAASRIRFYEAERLISEPQRQENGYRNYPPETALSLMLIDKAQRFGFSLEQIRKILPQKKGGWDHGALVASLQSRVDEIRLLQQQLENNQKQIESLIADIENRPEGISCQENTLRIMNHL